MPGTLALPLRFRKTHTEPRFHPVLFWRLLEINLKFAKSFGSPYNEFTCPRTNATPQHRKFAAPMD
jgi:hypothetical protein